MTYDSSSADVNSDNPASLVSSRFRAAKMVRAA